MCESFIESLGGNPVLQFHNQHPLPSPCTAWHNGGLSCLDDVAKSDLVEPETLSATDHHRLELFMTVVRLAAEPPASFASGPCLSANTISSRRRPRYTSGGRCPGSFKEQPP